MLLSGGLCCERPQQEDWGVGEPCANQIFFFTSERATKVKTDDSWRAGLAGAAFAGLC